MTRVKTGMVAHRHRKDILKAAKGYFGSKHRLYKTAKEQLMHSRAYAFRDRKQNKRNFRKLWITRINAACRENNISYSKFINGLTKAGLLINRKMLAELAFDAPQAFTDLVTISVDALNGKAYEPKKVTIAKAEKAGEPNKVAKKETVEAEKSAKKTTKKVVKEASEEVKTVKKAVKKSPAKKPTTKTK